MLTKDDKARLAAIRDHLETVGDGERAMMHRQIDGMLGRPDTRTGRRPVARRVEDDASEDFFDNMPV